MSKRGAVVNRPLKKGEFTIEHATRSAADGWNAMLSTRRNAVVDAWEWLTSTPLEETLHNYALQGDMGFVTRDGHKYQRWQFKLSGGARIWFYVDGHTVYLEKVHTAHPNETKRRGRS